VQIHVSPDDGVPVYQQIVNQVRYLIGSGVLAADEELPPIRTLAEQLVINPNTVARAYRELEHAGLVYKKGTVGTFVSAERSPLARRERLRILRRRVDSLLAEAKHLDVTTQEIKALLDEREDAMQNEKRPKGVPNAK
jgi:GntR family transcriptional regulator